MLIVSQHLIYTLLVALFLLSGRGFSQTEWYDYYRNAQEAIARNQWQTAISELAKALEKKPDSQRNVETYALQFVDYIPYYWRGICYFNLGDFRKAHDDFNTSFSRGVIQKTTYKASAEYYLQLTAKILARADSLSVLKQEIDRLQKSSISSLKVQQLFSQIESALQNGNMAAAEEALLKIKELSPSDPSLPALEKLLQRWREAQSLPPAPVTAAADPLAEKFEQAMAFYLAGNYQEALGQFQQVNRQSPGYRRVNDWIRKTLGELERLGQKPPVDTVVVTGAPGIALAPLKFSTRDDSILISGMVNDDQGLRFIEFNLNGKSYTTPRGEKVQLQPSSPSEQTNFQFSVMMPLRMGENEIVVVAHDIDPENHFANHSVKILRKPPIYKTPGFFIAIGIILLLVVGILLASEMIKRRIAFVDKYNPYIAGAPVRNEKMFYGRETLIRRLINNLHNNSLMIYGPRRIGKTSLLHQLKKKLEDGSDHDYFYVPVYIDLQGTPENKFFATMMHDILESCQSHLRQPLTFRIQENSEEYSARDFSGDIKQLLDHLQMQTSRKLKLVLLIDEVDELNSYSERINQKLRSIFMKTFAENLVAIMSGTHIRKRWESEGSPWYNFFEEIAVSGIDRKDAEELIRHPVRGIFSYEDEAVQKIIEYSGNIPYRIQKFCVNVISQVIEARRRRVTAEDVEKVRAKVLESEEEEKDNEWEVLKK